MATHPPTALWRLLFAIAALFAACAPAAADPAMEQSLERIRHEWAVVTFQVPVEKRAGVLETLAEMAHQLTVRFPERPEPMVWEGIVLTAFADTRGPLLGYLTARRARELLLEAERRDPLSLSGLGYASLGMLYARALPWPLSFGDPVIARGYLEKALAMQPDSMEANLLYGAFLLEQGDYTGAARRLRRALAMPSAPDLSVAAPLPRVQILRLLAQAERHP